MLLSDWYGLFVSLLGVIFFCCLGTSPGGRIHMKHVEIILGKTEEITDKSGANSQGLL